MLNTFPVKIGSNSTYKLLSFSSKTETKGTSIMWSSLTLQPKSTVPLALAATKP
jgi:hypothetical protein